MTLQRIGVVSAFRVGVVVYGLLFAVFGGVGLLCNLALLAPLGATGFMVEGDVVSANVLGGMGLIGVGVLCLVYVIGAAATALFGGFSLALMALFYNWAVRWVGGIEVELAGPGGQSSAGTILSDMTQWR